MLWWRRGEIMIFLLVLITLVLMFYLGVIKTRTVKNPLSFFLFFWGLWTCLSMLNPYSLYSVSEKAYLLIWLNIFAFSIGFILISRKKSQDISINVSFSKKTEKLLLLIQVCLLIILTYYYIKYNSVMSRMLITDARIVKFQIGYLFGNYTEYLLFNYFVAAALYVSVIINIVKYSVDRKKKASLLITLINIYLFAGIGLGRFIFFNTIVFIILAFTIYRGSNLMTNIAQKGNRRLRIRSKKSKLKYIPLIFVGIYFMTRTTAIRTGSTIDSFESFWRWFEFSVGQGVVYFLGPFRAFDNFLLTNPANTFTLGRATLGGLDEIINNLFIIVGISINTANSIMSSFTVDSIIIGHNGQTFNAFYTGITNFYLDGGISFVIVIPFIFGIIIAGCWNLYNKKPSLYTLAIMVFMIKTSLAYQYRWDFSAPFNWIVITILFLLYRIEKNKEVNFIQ